MPFLTWRFWNTRDNKNELTAHTCRYICELSLYKIRYKDIYTTGRTAFKLAPDHVEFSRFSCGTKLFSFPLCLPPHRQAATRRIPRNDAAKIRQKIRTAKRFGEYFVKRVLGSKRYWVLKDLCICKNEQAAPRMREHRRCSLLSSGCCANGSISWSVTPTPVPCT